MPCAVKNRINGYAARSTLLSYLPVLHSGQGQQSAKGNHMPPPLLPNLPLAIYNELTRSEFFQPHRAEGMEFGR